MLSASALLWTRIAAAVFLFLAANAAYGIFLQRKKMNRGKSWPIAPGEIVASEVEQPRTHRFDDDADCTVNIRYRYRVDGKDYEGHRVRFGGQPHTTRRQAEELTSKYPVGARVDVHHEPQKPAEAVLEPQDRSNVAAVTSFFVVFSIIAAVLVAHAVAGKVLATAAGVPLFAFLLPIAVIGFGVVAIVAYLKLRRERTASAAWPTVPGTITQSGVVTELEQDSDSNRTEEKYRVDIRFSYQVAGRAFNSSHWNWGWTALHSDRAAAEAIAARYPAGKGVAVYYDAAQPETAVLDPTDKRGVAVPLMIGIFCLVAGAVVLLALANVQ